MEKLAYEEPKMELVIMETPDVITTSTEQTDLPWVTGT